MKVLILATDIFTRGGIARYTSTLATSLGDLLGPENVDVLCFFDWGNTGQVPAGFQVSGLVSNRKGAGLISRAKFLLKTAFAGAQGYDLIIANHVALAPVAALLKLAYGTPFWVSCHSVEIWWGTSRARHAALKRADLILPVSQYTADIVKKMDGIDAARVKVLYNAVPDTFSALLAETIPTPTPAPTVLSVCALVPGNEFKGIDSVIRALPEILKTQPSLRYLVVGEGELRPGLEQLAAETGVAANVTFLGEIPDSQLAQLYSSCDVFILPSRGQSRGEIGGEGFGRVYVEAALAGKPVIGSRTGGAAEAVLPGKTGILVNPESIGEIADAVLAMVGDHERAAHMGAEGRKWALETFSEKALSRSLCKMLQPYGLKGDCPQQLAQAEGNA